MVVPATQRLKCNPPLGRMPVLQFVPPAELDIDASYQRSIESGGSRALVRRIAQYWNWDLCQPLVVARRRSDAGERLFVIDGQHRLAASRLRGDIGQLPCVVVEFANAGDEAASFVHLNQERQALSKLDIFKAAVASEDPESLAIVAALEAQGLSIAPHSNHTAWKPGMLSNIGGLQSVWRKRGARVAEMAMRALAQAFAGQVLRYGGTLFPGIAAVCASEFREHGGFDDLRFEKFVTMLALRSQTQWRSEVLKLRVESPALNFGSSSEAMLCRAWDLANGITPARLAPRPAVVPASPLPLRVAAFTGGRGWCDQCDAQVTKAEAEGCKSRHCSMKVFA